MDDSASEESLSVRNSGVNLGPVSSIESSNFKWQKAMEEEFDTLVETIRPFFSSPELAPRLFRLIRKNRGVRSASAVHLSFDGGH